MAWLPVPNNQAIKIMKTFIIFSELKGGAQVISN